MVTGHCAQGIIDQVSSPITMDICSAILVVSITETGPVFFSRFRRLTLLQGVWWSDVWGSELTAGVTVEGARAAEIDRESPT